ncbi:MAG: hypothetical protein R3261_02945 [Alphaproteobacteria bacterium]|nr:hypothetical protein [Alphaproteobacteria bacterium]
MKHINMKALDANEDPVVVLDHLAQPFLDLAQKLEAARLEGIDQEEWVALTDTNMFYWRFIVNYLPKNFESRVSPASKAMLEMIADFMIRAAKAMRRNPDGNILKQMVQMNLNMSDQILTIAEKLEENRRAGKEAALA